MKPSERLAHDHFSHLGFTNIVYEPEGSSIFPDFLLDGRIAVDVCELNHTEAPKQPGMKSRALKEDEIPFEKTVRSLLQSLGPATGPNSWFVCIKYSRPIPNRRDVEEALRQRLQEFRDGPSQEATTLHAPGDLEIQLLRASRLHSQCFVFGGVNDRDGACEVIPELERNVQACIAEKSARMSAFRAENSEYSEWWLLLVDYFNFGEVEPIQIPTHDWDRIIFLSPIDPTVAFVL